MQYLQPGITLQGGKYKIEKVLGQGGFGITYLAIQSGLERKVAIKEFFMKELCERDESTSHVTLGTSGSAETVGRFREKFLKEARNIARLDHPNIVSVIDVFEENGTAYYVMKYAENGSLSDKVKREGYLTEPMATRYILHVASALEYIHQQKMNHLDIKPANIMLNEKDEAVLIDFGLSKQYDAVTGNQTSTTPVGISEGYAPMEQYKKGGVGEFSPETDIYALGATFFKLLTGATPPSASDINEDGVPVAELRAKGVSREAIDVICKAMEGRKKDRMKEVSTFIASLKGAAPTTPHASAPVPTPVIQEEDEATLFTSKMQCVEEIHKPMEGEAMELLHENLENVPNINNEKSTSISLLTNSLLILSLLLSIFVEVVICMDKAPVIYHVSPILFIVGLIMVKQQKKIGLCLAILASSFFKVVDSVAFIIRGIEITNSAIFYYPLLSLFVLALACYYLWRNKQLTTNILCFNMLLILVSNILLVFLNPWNPPMEYLTQDWLSLLITVGYAYVLAFIIYLRLWMKRTADGQREIDILR